MCFICFLQQFIFLRGVSIWPNDLLRRSTTQIPRNRRRLPNFVQKIFDKNSVVKYGHFMSRMYDETSHFRKWAKSCLECCDFDYFYPDRLLLLCYCKFRITALSVTVYNGGGLFCKPFLIYIILQFNWYKITYPHFDFRILFLYASLWRNFVSFLIENFD